ncbi:cytochrome ubiquinol oxidase subunit I [Brevibacillus agri]|uniref:Cytochrome ubiquinol oxidase subunit I n=1 Tax=Brevibacillus agri TaxID=51101 RepID=A0A3M8B457_9BACL|nr:MULTISPECIES: cytochrome ubiquinol oxidase subunit I [Brevibacillus]MCG5249768.1 cytochrome ubiquinol oxidase subunit I [Brevibacillus agri]MDN4091899.1 cytochrome ubiquinol oxidase subunit I [Brevibacillus agri]QAV14542.1 cytochrome ubiquinol oxidase subunit I [Brevibacillus agri]QHZ57180.1 cytochrome ubiquinol oxidase subunit I [Brevibacillus sp. NSP2.1]RNB58231.1 cytochrome ubiquinol oxidase subunit I [Brevibacillus agri]
MDLALQSRILFGLTLGFHIIYATIGVGMPLLLLLAETMGIVKKDQQYRLLARRLAKGYSITVAVGVVTGTIIGLQLSLLFPGFMKIAGQVISLPLFMETFAFFFEAIFLGIYLYTWSRFKKPLFHLLVLIPVAIGSGLSAFFITTVNAFMNTPQGFTIENGAIANIEPLKAMFNPATPTKVAHVLTSAYMTTAFVIAAIAAWFILRGHRNEYYKKALRLSMMVGLIFAVATAVVGDLSGKFLAAYQPEKLAAAEWHFETKTHADLLVGGTLDRTTNEVNYALRLPSMLSFLATDSFQGEVTGLNDIPKENWPPLIIHYWFDLMVGIGSFMIVLSCIFVACRIWKPQLEWNRWLLGLIVLGGPLSMLAIEFGWIFAEVGRQPWILRGYMTVAEAATTSPDVGAMLVLFSVIYALLGILTVYVLVRMARRNPVEPLLDARSEQT